MSDVRVGVKRGSAAKKPGEDLARSGSSLLRIVRCTPDPSAVTAAAAPSVAAESTNVSIGSTPRTVRSARAPAADR